MGDFTGFTFGGVKSSDLGIIRVSGGDRYEEQLSSEIKDRTVEVPGLNGEYYFGSDYGPRTIDIEIAFDSLTEEQFRKLRRTFNTKRNKTLIFDERPYKKYIAKLESPIELSYVCFDEPKKIVGSKRDGVRVLARTTDSSIVGDATTGAAVVGKTEDFQTTLIREEVTPYVVDHTQTQRIYKGEGKISFICYFPFAKSAFKVLPEESGDWAISSGILTAEEYQEYDVCEDGIIKIYNPGDVETGFRLYIPSSGLSSSQIILIYKPNRLSSADTSGLIINPITVKDDDVGVLVDTNSQLIIGVSSFTHDVSGNAIYKTSGNIYNEYIEVGEFFKLQPNTKFDDTVIQVIGDANNIEIFYDYLYF